MKLKTLTIHNIASIEDATIDFASGKLAKQDLFLICGPTGSGKTTILDAICLALFNNTPRIANSSNDIVNNLADEDEKKKETVKDVLNLVRKNAVNAEVTLTFEGFDGNEYKAIWRIYRAGQYKAGKEVSTFAKESLAEKLKRGIIKEWTLIDYEGKTYEKVKEVSEKIIEVIKMDFDQFCKTTMLAQGDFTKFLSCKADEKADILEKLVGISKYSEVGRVINRIAKEKKIDVDVLSKELENIQFLSGEEIVGKRQNIDSLNAGIKEIGEKKNAIERKLQWIDSHAKTLAAILQNEKFIADNSPKLKEFAESLLSLEKEKEKLEELKAEATKKIGELEKSIEAQKGRLKEKGADTIVREMTALHNRSVLIKDVESVLRLLNEANQELSTKHEKAAKTAKALSEAVIVESAKRNLWDEASSELKASKELYEKTKASISDHAKVLRSQLQAGDICPVCGNLVNSILSDEGFIAALLPLEERFKADEANELKLRNEYSLAKASLSVLQKTAETDSREENAAKTKVENNKRTLQTKCLALGIDCEGEVLSVLKILKQKNEEESEMISKRQTEINAIRAEMDKTIEAVGRIRREEISVFDLRLSSLQRNKERIVSESAVLAGRITSSQNNIEQLQKDLQQLESSENKPSEEERASSISLNEQKALLAQDEREKAQMIGRLQSELDADNRNRQLQGKKKEALDELRMEYAEWEKLNKYLGNTDGKNFRNVAQSFILNDLLDKANAYLENITGRYTLFCNPGTLTILLRDAYQGGVVRPTNTLSGGESFIISLSLALGLSSMKSSGFEVDTLFIDEGFGTLSPEFIDPVIFSLKRLYQTYGRRVGIISHVEALKSRIPFTIEVSNHSLSYLY